jgi:hypothetical protein
MMNSVIRCIKAICCLVKAWLGLPYVPTGILVLLAFTSFSKPPDLILTATLLFAFPVSWLCRLQCERELRFYKKLCMDSKSYRQAKTAKSTKRLTRALEAFKTKKITQQNKSLILQNSVLEPNRFIAPLKSGQA